MNKVILLLSLILVSCYANGQEITDRSASQKPVWFEEKPQSEIFLYYIGFSNDVSLQTAKQYAVNDVIQQLSNEGKFTITVESKTKISNQTENQNVNSSIDFEATINNTGEKISIRGLRIEEEYWQRRNGKYEYWVLIRKPKQENTDVNFQMKQGYGMSALWRSMIIPGWGQLFKKEKKKGIMIFSGEAICILGAVISENQRSSNWTKSIQTRTVSLKKSYLSDADTWENTRNIFIAGGIGIYLYNLIDVITSKGAKKYANNLREEKYKFSPCLINDSFGFALTVRLK
ncbi:MAG: DUF5683 domain-containing protein [Bacteroidia bacterium]